MSTLTAAVPELTLTGECRPAPVCEACGARCPSCNGSGQVHPLCLVCSRVVEQIVIPCLCLGPRAFRHRLHPDCN